MIPTPAVDFGTTEDLAKALAAVAPSLGADRLMALPYNRFDTRDTTWWLSPPTDRPAYPHGKIVITDRDVAPNFFVGFYIEKGFKQSIAGRKNEATTMTKDWLWHEFQPALASGEVGKVVNGIAKRLDAPLMVAMDASMSAADRDNPTRSYLSFECDGDALASPKSDGPGPSLRDVAKATSLRQLPEYFTQIQDGDWVWIDLYFGLRFVKQGAPQHDVWEADTIWTKLCIPWASWLR